MSSEDHLRSKQTSNSPVTCHTQAFCRPLLPAVLLRCENNNFPLLITECEFLALPSDLFPHDLHPSFFLVHKDQQQDYPIESKRETDTQAVCGIFDNG